MAQLQNQSNWAANVVEKYQNLGKLTGNELEARERYMKQIKSFGLFGATLFKAKVTLSNKK